VWSILFVTFAFVFDLVIESRFLIVRTRSPKISKVIETVKICVDSYCTHAILSRYVSIFNLNRYWIPA